MQIFRLEVGREIWGVTKKKGVVHYNHPIVVNLLRMARARFAGPKTTGEDEEEEEEKNDVA
jgi:hypothetical protein